MSKHPLLSHLHAALETPDEITLARLKDDGWFSPLWMTGSSTTYPNGQVAIEFSATEVGDDAPPMLFVYVDESQVRQHNPEGPVMSYPLGVIALLAHQRSMDLAVVDGDDMVGVAHPQILALRNFMAFDSPQASRDAQADSLFLNRVTPFMSAACNYCLQQGDIRTLHLAVVTLGGTPMQAALLLNASNALLHQARLEEMYMQQMLPGDGLIILDRLNLDHESMVAALDQQVPIYENQTTGGWWHKLMRRLRRPRLVILSLDVTKEKVDA